MSKLIILSSPSGCGKSTLAKDIVRALHSQGKTCQIFSTDSFWIRATGTYDFNPRLLEEAHQYNFDKFKSFLEDSDFQKVDCTAIIDNTNLRFSEYQKYVELALRSKWEVEINRLNCPYTDEDLFHRNIHKVPLEVIHRQRERWENLESMQNSLARLREKICGT